MTCKELQMRLWRAESKFVRHVSNATEVDWGVTLTKVCLAKTNFCVFFTLS